MADDGSLCGDFNIAHTPLDIKRQSQRKSMPGFLPEERALRGPLAGEYGFVDVTRALAGEVQGRTPGGASTWPSLSTTTSAGGSTTSSPRAGLAQTAVDFAIDKAPSYGTDGPTMRR